MKYLRLFEDFERSAYTKISPKTLQRGNEYLQEVCPFLNIDLYEDVDVIPGGHFSYNDVTYDSIEAIIDVELEKALSIWDYRQHKYTINNGLLDVDDVVDISEKKLTKIPYKFGKVTYIFNCGYNQLTTLKGSPHTTGGAFDCECNQLTTLEYAPHTVGWSFWCQDNNLTTLKGAPEYVDKEFRCNNNQLTNLKHLPEKIGGRIYCGNNPNLIDFSDVPEEWRDKLIK